MESLLQLIPEKELSTEQKRLRPRMFGTFSPLYRLLSGEPTQLYDFGWDNHRNCTIWRDNGTVICIGHCFYEEYEPHGVLFSLYDNAYDEELQLSCGIYGENDAAIAATATFFWSLKHPVETELCVLRIHGRRKFPVTVFEIEQLLQILESNPERHVDLQTGTWSDVQAAVLATRPLSLRLSNVFAWADNGSAFVDALQGRSSPFRSLCIDFDNKDTPFSKENLKRLFELENNKFDWLRMDRLEDEELVLLAFSAKTDYLEYKMDAQDVEPEDFKEINIRAKTLDLTLFLDWVDNWDELVVAFFHRVAELGHMERLSLSLKYMDWRSSEEPERNEFDTASLAQALICLIKGNPNLQHLDVSDILWCVDDEPHLPQIFEAMEDHPSLHEVLIEGCKDESEDDGFKYSGALGYAALERLLSRNRYIKIFNFQGKRITNGTTIDELYRLNACYVGSLQLITDTLVPDSRFHLVITALVQSTSGRFRATGVLLSHHTDLLCELVTELL
ncbi:hypothetical protein FisN_10Lh370 [Fistulifera solaris]|uniref:Uncharacterized protein n=1 Tax=Fistulifera solaris TaxID=1519565 RepID=A0A1Z5JUX4_FISSO|nr:hypothetical protein FisN_10Lh370 [Fistulifera solaris]|eukprot:GAX17666.1 hypothetical protein FisN_10Lh370 [Fistulifera solaris]